MKVFKEIIILGILLIIIFVINNDYKSIYNETISYIKDKTSLSSQDYIKEKVFDAMSKINTNSGKTSSVDTPGALIVSSEYLTSNSKDINLNIKNIIDATNNQRIQNGELKLLSVNTKLNFSAEKKVQDMFVKQYFEHESPSGVGVGKLGDEVGYEYILIGENLALGNFKDEESLINAWMDSPGHRANILNDKYTEIGVSALSGKYQGKNVWLAVQHFGLPKSACPSIDDVLKGMINLEQNQVKELEIELISKKSNIDSGVVSGGLTIGGQIESYNKIVSKYNEILSNIKNKINIYNQQVKEFNACLDKVSN